MPLAMLLLVCPPKRRLRNERRNFILMMRHHLDLGSASDWSCRMGNLIQPIRSTTQIWVVTHHQYGISANGSIAKSQLFSQATLISEDQGGKLLPIHSLK